MDRRTLLQSIPAAAVLGALAVAEPQDHMSANPSSAPVFELRIYHTFEGKLDDLLARFREQLHSVVAKPGQQIIQLAFKGVIDAKFEDWSG